MAEAAEGGHHFDTKKLTAMGVLVSLGIVFGDIGTSPLYVMKAHQLSSVSYFLCKSTKKNLNRHTFCWIFFKN